MGGFLDQIRLFTANAQVKTSKAIEHIRIGVAESVINKTPVDTGEARGNWQSSTGSPITSKIDRFDKEAGFAPTSGDGISLREAISIAKENIDKDFYIMNNAEHIQYLEYTGSYLGSEQAPSGMVRITVADFQNIVSDAIKNLK